MKVALCYKPYMKWPKWRWVQEALAALGHSVVHAQTIEEVAEADRVCDLVLFEHREPPCGRKAAIQLAKTRKAPWYQWWFDLFVAQPHQNLLEFHAPFAAAIDGIFVKEPTEPFQPLGLRALYLDQACPSGMTECKRLETPEFDVVLFGSAEKFYTERIQAVEHLVRAGFSVGWATEQGTLPKGVQRLPWCHPEELPSLLSRGAVCLCVDMRHDVPGYWSDRFWLAMGAGAPIVKPNVENQPNEHFQSYFKPNGLIGLCAELVANYTLRESIGSAARRGTMLRHTYKHRIRTMFHALGLE